MARRIKVSLGDLFAIPRRDGKNNLGQVLEEWTTGVICIAVFDKVLDELTPPPDFSRAPTVLAMPSVAKAELSKGYWQTIGTAPIIVDPRLAPHYLFEPPKFLGASWHSGGKIEDLVDAFYGLATWEPYPGRPGHLKSLLLAEQAQRHGN